MEGAPFLNQIKSVGPLRMKRIKLEIWVIRQVAFDPTNQINSTQFGRGEELLNGRTNGQWPASVILTHHENQARPVLDDSNIYSDFNKDTKTTTLTDYNRSLIIVTNAETRRRKKGNTGPKSPAETDLRTSVHFRSGAKYAPSFRKNETDCLLAYSLVCFDFHAHFASWQRNWNCSLALENERKWKVKAKSASMIAHTAHSNTCRCRSVGRGFTATTEYKIE